MTMVGFSNSARRVACLGLAAAMALSACDSSGGPSFDNDASRLDKLVTVFTKQSGANVKGTLSVVGGQQYQIAGAWSGANVNAGSGSVSAPIRIGTSFVPTNVRWAKGAMYFERSTTATATGPLRPFVFRTAAQAPWLRVPSGAISTQPVVAYIPPEVIALVQRVGGGFTATAKKSGVQEFQTKNELTLVAGLPKSKVQLWLNERNELVRVRFAPTGFVLDYEVSNWGDPKVEAPPAPSEAANLNGTVAEVYTPTGPFTKVREGAAPGIQWQLERSTGSGNSECWRVVSTPSVPLIAGNVDYHCSVAYRPDIDDVESAVHFELVDKGSVGIEMLVAVLPPGSTDVRLGFVGASTLRAIEEFPVVAFGRAQAGPGYLGLTLADGTKLDCGRGGISVAADLRDSNVIGNLAGTPWSCQTA